MKVTKKLDSAGYVRNTSRVIRVSDHTYKTLKNMKEDLGLSSLGDAIRILLDASNDS